MAMAPPRDSDGDLEQDAAAMRAYYADPANNAAVLGVLYEKYNRHLLGYLWRLVGNPEDAQDLAQNVWARVMAQEAGDRGAFDPARAGRGGFWTWLSFIARSVATGYFRSRSARRGYSLDDERAAELADGQACDPADYVAIWEHVEALPLEFRQVFILRCVDECDFDEIAEVLNTPKKTVYTRYFRARQLLQAALGADFNL
jgi:RNA polymerase sigma-70 factor, ECF subfamily